MRIFALLILVIMTARAEDYSSFILNGKRVIGIPAIGIGDTTIMIAYGSMKVHTHPDDLKDIRPLSKEEADAELARLSPPIAPRPKVVVETAASSPTSDFTRMSKARDALKDASGEYLRALLEYNDSFIGKSLPSPKLGDDPKKSEVANADRNGQANAFIFQCAQIKNDIDSRLKSALDVGDLNQFIYQLEDLHFRSRQGSLYREIMKLDIPVWAKAKAIR